MGCDDTGSLARFERLAGCDRGQLASIAGLHDARDARDIGKPHDPFHVARTELPGLLDHDDRTRQLRFHAGDLFRSGGAVDHAGMTRQKTGDGAHIRVGIASELARLHAGDGEPDHRPPLRLRYRRHRRHRGGLTASRPALHVHHPIGRGQHQHGCGFLAWIEPAQPQLACYLLHPDRGVDRRNDRGGLPLSRLDRGKIRLLQPHRALRRHHAIVVVEQQAFLLQQRQPGLDIADRHRPATRQALADEFQLVERCLPLAQVAHRRCDRVRYGISSRLQPSQPFGHQRVAVARGQPHAAGDS